LHYSASALLGAFYEWGKKKSCDVFFLPFEEIGGGRRFLTFRKPSFSIHLLSILIKDQNYLAIVYLN